MITNFRRLSTTLRKAAPSPGETLTAAIRVDKERINRELKEGGASSVTVEGKTFRISTNKETENS